MTQYRNLIRAVAIALLAAAPLSAEAAPAASAPAAASAIHSTSYHFATVNGRKIFYREAGDPAAPTIVLLHGFPSSSQMYRDLIPQLADKFHVIAPDYVGFGQSDAPPASEFDYNFDNLAAHVADLIDQLGLKSYVLYMQDYGGPVGFRLFAQRPTQVKGFVIQNANAYLDGVGDPVKQALLPIGQQRNAASEASARTLLTLDTTRFQYSYGAKNPDAINPDNWTIDQALLDRPGNDAIQLDLFEDYRSNVASYDKWHALFRQYRPKTLILWGKNDPIFIAPGAEAYKRDLPDARLVWLDAGHFVIDENAVTIGREIKASFAGR
ncbi:MULTISPECIES: alpha/beta hydrolase [unclassified Sphingopyxis]|uniref:alpha/beta fold hydrolase n=1 Tax=unclassified Sphingopyxis TaxID=2614943 RepID=UPI0024AD28E0|nr:MULTISPECIES: alpha/beta hydrolase [unclassified Sphingopyxis]